MKTCKISRAIALHMVKLQLLELNNWMCVEAWFCQIWSHIMLAVFIMHGIAYQL